MPRRDGGPRRTEATVRLDQWSKNLFADGDETVAIDWGFVGDGAIGEDIGTLILDAAFDHFIAAERLAELEACVLDAHTDGLARAGWIGDARIARLGMSVMAVKYDWLTPFMLSAANAERQFAYGGTEEVDTREHFHQRGLALLHVARWADRALALADELRM